MFDFTNPGTVNARRLTEKALEQLEKASQQFNGDAIQDAHFRAAEILATLARAAAAKEAS